MRTFPSLWLTSVVIQILILTPFEQTTSRYGFIT
jgi:hypothetical protein